MTEKINLSCKLSFFSNEAEDSRFQNVKLKIVHSGENDKGLNITQEAIDNAKETLKNIPIVAYIKRDEDGEALDFEGHKILLKIVQTSEGLTIKNYYEERPIGIIPESTIITDELDEDNNKVYTCATGKVWTAYSNEALDLLLEADEKSVSMEIIIHERGEDGEITSFSFQGITVLGDDISPGIEGANIITYSQGNLEAYRKEIQKFCRELEKEKEGIKLPEDKTIEMFGLSIRNFSDQIYDLINNRLVERTNCWGETFKEREFFYRDIIPGENIVVVESSRENKYFGISYSLNGDVLSMDFDNQVPYISEWRPMKEGENPTHFSLEKEFENELEKVAFEKIETLNTSIATNEAKIGELNTEITNKDTKISELQTEIENFDAQIIEKDNKIQEINSELERLQAFEKEIHKEKLINEVNSILEKFSLEDEEVSDFKEKALNGELSVELFEKELFALEGMKAIQARANKGTTEPVASVKVPRQEEKKNRPYGTILD